MSLPWPYCVFYSCLCYGTSSRYSAPEVTSAFLFSCVVQLCESTHNSSQSDRKSGAGEFMNSEHCLMLNLMITVCLEKGGPTDPISTQSLTPSNEWILQPYIQNASQLSKTLSSLCFSFFFFFYLLPLKEPTCSWLSSPNLFHDPST